VRDTIASAGGVRTAGLRACPMPGMVTSSAPGMARARWAGSGEDYRVLGPPRSPASACARRPIRPLDPARSGRRAIERPCRATGVAMVVSDHVVVLGEARQEPVRPYEPGRVGAHHQQQRGGVPIAAVLDPQPHVRRDVDVTLHAVIVTAGGAAPRFRRGATARRVGWVGVAAAAGERRPQFGALPRRCPLGCRWLCPVPGRSPPAGCPRRRFLGWVTVAWPVPPGPAPPASWGRARTTRSTFCGVGAQKVERPAGARAPRSPRPQAGRSPSEFRAYQVPPNSGTLLQRTWPRGSSM
jgi:hypothetical protein